MPTHLKRLELHGFKSFATTAGFVFDDGITAVIGPNGSGKSNIADALRWVLGEQSYASLRGRRTEDVIFAGSAARAPVGMAEVALTLSNDDGELPVPFSEVTIARRAYRSGENQYLINGARVRLKDVLQLTASLGQAHTVIGQGLVDAVLSQRAEERRGLLEHAAGISALRLKYAEAGRHLAESQNNSVRLEDLLTESEPRLRSLERAAKQARERGQVRDELNSALILHFGWQLRSAKQRLDEAIAARRAADESHSCLEAERQRAREGLERHAAVLRERQATLDRLTAEEHQLHAACDRLVHEIAILRERRHALVSRQEDLDRSQHTLAEGNREVEGELAALAARLGQISDEVRERERRQSELEATVADERRRQAERERQLQQLSRELRAAEQRRAEAETRLTLLAGQESDLRAERTELETQAAGRADQIREQRAQHERATAARDDAGTRLVELEGVQRELETQLAAAEAPLAEATATSRAVERRLFELNARYDALAQLEESGAGFHASVKSVLDAARDGTLAGIVGTLASLLRVPGELEAAIEAALGGHLQDVVVERWHDAERAIEHLKRTRAGRVTFQPLDTLREGRSSGRPPAGRGIRGVAADLIDYDPRAGVAVHGLLGRVLVTEDLATTRSVLGSLPGGWSVVTLGGEIARSSGAVTGGARVRESGVLARERELRELPGRITAIAAELERARAAAAARAKTLAELREARSAGERVMSEAREAVRAAVSGEERAARALADLQRSEQRVTGRIAEIERRVSGIDAARAAARMAAAEAEAAVAALSGKRDEFAASQQGGTMSEAAARLAEIGAELRARIEERRGIEAQRDRLRQRQAGLARQQHEGQERRRRLAEELDQVRSSEANLHREQEQAAATLSELNDRLQPVRHSLAEAGTAAANAQARVTELDERDRVLERERDRLELECSRRDDEVNLILERAAIELEVEDAGPMLGHAEEVSDPLVLEGRINRLRERLRRIGLVAEDAVEQFERESERYVFLRQQLDDVRSAGDSLRSLLGQLDRTMDDAMDRTFGEVAEAFATTFTALFGGGKARLVRSDDESGGLDIVAQPPGKRLQNLALLSGGERALTAVALLFAILKVNPSPFCLLDEVDAALDEANVVRVRDELRGLAERTQFVVVTHNRATIEGADTLYGITMGDDGVSRTLSLRLPAEATT